MSDCMAFQKTAPFIVTGMKISNLTKVHFGKTVQSGACIDDETKNLK
jgi:hypothetical protein